MTLSRPLVCLDTETTGVDPVEDRVIELGIMVLHPDNTRTKWQRRFNPGIPIKKEATEVHGITDADLVNEPPFSDYAAKIHRGLWGRDIAGYNLRRLDIPILDEELRRCGLKLDLTDVNVIDAAGIFFNKEPRDLTAAVKKYLGRDHAGAHGAAADAEATLDVLFAQLALYDDLGALDLAGVAAFSKVGDKDFADLCGKLYRDSDGDLRYNFGKARDVKVKDDPGFGNWMRGRGFPGSTMEVLMGELRRHGLA